MKTFFSFAMALVALCGCTRQPSNANSGAQTAAPVAAPQASSPETPQASPASAHPVPESPTPTVSDADRPKTIDEFRSEFVRLYQKDMYAPFIEFAYWGASTDEQKKEFLFRVRSVYLASPKGEPAEVKSLDDVQVMPIAEYREEGFSAALTAGGNELVPLVPEPTHVLTIEGHVVEPGKQQSDTEDESDSTVSTDFAVGVRDGKYYFCTIKHE